MIKLMMFMRRKPGITREELIARYEGHHPPLVDRLVADGSTPPLVDYRRNYLLRDDPLSTAKDGELDFDVVTTAVYETREQCAQMLAGLADPVEAFKVTGDDMWMDTASWRAIVVEEHIGGGEAWKAKKS